MRVGYLFNHAEIVGGGELSLIDLIDGIREKGIVPVAVVPGEGEIKCRLEAAGIRCVQFDWARISMVHPFRFFIRQRRLSNLFRNEGFDVVHANGARCMLYAGSAARRCMIPCVWHVRVCHRDAWLDRVRAHYASAIIANSGAVAASFEQLGVPGDDVDIIYNGFKIQEIEKAVPSDLASTFGISVKPVVLAVGRFSPWKRFEDLISAADQLTRSGRKFSVIIAGRSLPEEQAYEERLRQMVSELGLTNVHFAGWRDDVAAIMKSSDILALTSDCEPFGRVVVESWICGLPVVATRAGGPAEIIRHGENGLLYEPCSVEGLSKCLGTLMSDSSLRASLAREAKKDTGRFSVAGHAENVRLVYNRLLEHKPGG